MSERLPQPSKSKIIRFYRSFSPSSRAALIFVIPFAIVDAIHYYTAGTALVLSLPLVIIFYSSCGFLAGRFASQEGGETDVLVNIGAIAGGKLWFLSTLVNMLIAAFVGASSLGITLFLGIPYLLLCAPILMIGGLLLGGLGGYFYGFIHERINNVNKTI
jgi:hypothetical protein